jgi:hypothetical protein
MTIAINTVLFITGFGLLDSIISTPDTSAVAIPLSQHHRQFVAGFDANSTGSSQWKLVETLALITLRRSQPSDLRRRYENKKQQKEKGLRIRGDYFFL